MKIAQVTKPKPHRPQNEGSMKGLIDLHKVINENMYARVQDTIPNSDCLGLTKEQRTRLASLESRSNANKAIY